MKEEIQKEDPCYVYLMEDLSYGGVKIGISHHPKERRWAVKTEYGTEIALRYVVKFSSQRQAFLYERRMHKELAEYRRDGEWFYLSLDQIMAVFPKLHYRPVDLESPVEYVDKQEKIKQIIPRKKYVPVSPATHVLRIELEIFELRMELKIMELRLSVLEAKYWGAPTRNHPHLRGNNAK